MRVFSDIPKPRVIVPEIRRVVSAAARNSRGQIIASPRHCDLIFHQTVVLIKDEKEQNEWTYHSEQGFIDQWGVFMTREEAWEVALAANQVYKRVGGDNGKLYSENLY